MAFPMSIIPDLPLLGLSDDERALITELESVAFRCRGDMELSEAYYLGEQVVQNLRIAVPKELEFLRTIVGWPAIAVDPVVERLGVDGFRLPNATQADQTLAELWDANGLEAEQSLAFTDALSMGRGFWVVGSNPDGGAPRITVESPLNMAVLWDLGGRVPRAAMQEFWSEGRKHAAVLVPGKTITLAEDDAGAWEVVDRDPHGYDFVPVVRMSNRPRTHDRDGRSEITAAMRSITDAACRTLLGLEVARELYSVPQRVILGAAEDAFVNSDGTPKKGWDTYITKVLGLERNAEGELPEIKQLQVYDPATFTKLIEMYASQMAGMLAAPPQDLGLYTQGNPTSAESAQVSEQRRDRRAIQRQAMFGTPLVTVMQYGLRFQNGGRLPAEFARFAVDWRDVTLEPMSLASDGISKQIAAGAVPPTSDVVRKRLGYSAVERERLRQDEQRAQGRQAAQAIVDALNGQQQPPQGTQASGNAGL